MIKPIQNSISFKNNMQDYIAKTSKTSPGVSEPDGLNASLNTSLEKTSAEDSVDLSKNQENSDIKETENKKVSFKTRVLNFLKGINNVTNTTSGVAKGICEGTVAAGIIGFAGKNIKDAKGDIGKTLTGMFKDTGKVIAHVVTKSIPNIITKAPIENAKTIIQAPGKFYKGYLKGNKLTAAIATLAFVGVAAFRTIQGKFIANKKNADIDHYTKTKH